jgi:hypothetical protein
VKSLFAPFGTILFDFLVKLLWNNILEKLGLKDSHTHSKTRADIVNRDISFRALTILFFSFFAGKVVRVQPCLEMNALGFAGNDPSGMVHPRGITQHWDSVTLHQDSTALHLHVSIIAQ